MGSRNDYLVNIVGALCLAVTDAVNARLAAAVAWGPSAPALFTTLYFSPQLSIDELATVLGITVPGTVQLVNRMEAEGLARREVGADRRRRHLTLTDAGADLAEQVLAVRREVVSAAVSGLTRAEREQMLPLIEQMVMSMSGTRLAADRLCRLCDERSCPDYRCPSENALPLDARHSR